MRTLASLSWHFSVTAGQGHPHACALTHILTLRQKQSNTQGSRPAAGHSQNCLLQIEMRERVLLVALLIKSYSAVASFLSKHADQNMKKIHCYADLLPIATRHLNGADGEGRGRDHQCPPQSSMADFSVMRCNSLGSLRFLMLS